MKQWQKNLIEEAVRAQENRDNLYGKIMDMFYSEGIDIEDGHGIELGDILDDAEAMTKLFELPKTRTLDTETITVTNSPTINYIFDGSTTEQRTELAN